MDRDREVASLVEAVTWCETHKATVTWGGERDRACRVEVLAPGSHWQVLRGTGPALPDAYRSCRAQWEAEACRPAWRPGVLVGIGA